MLTASILDAAALREAMEGVGHVWHLAANAGLWAPDPAVFERINVGGEEIDVSTLSPELLAELNEIGGSEANVATGYHAIEFLLWGQDQHGYEAGAGERLLRSRRNRMGCCWCAGACASAVGRPHSLGLLLVAGLK